LYDLTKDGSTTELLEYLQSGGDVNVIVDSLSRRLIEMAASRGHAPIVQILLEHGASVETVGPGRLDSGIGYTLLHYAAYGDHLPLAVLLLRHGMNIDAPDSAYDAGGFTPLLEAITRGSIDVARLLLARGASPLIHNKKGWGPLHKAVERGITEFVS
ncbi:ankyrin repeat-containing domain protein, partial [Baffinella frigidus]